MKAMATMAVITLSIFIQSCASMESAQDWVASKYRYDIMACEDQTDALKKKHCDEQKNETIAKYKNYTSDQCYNKADQGVESNDCLYVLQLMRQEQAEKSMQDSKDVEQKRKQDFEKSMAESNKLNEQQIQKSIKDYPKVYEICKKQREQLGPLKDKLYSTKIAFGQSQSEMRKKELDAEYKKLEKQRDYVIYTYETNDCKRFFSDRL